METVQRRSSYAPAGRSSVPTAAIPVAINREI
jgi:hypothetical protein